jgi:uncharacterized glyoxalase superfamily protein PhnB
MTGAGPRFQPEGWHTVTPRIITTDPEALVGFLKRVFGAEGEFRPDRPAEMRIGDSWVMVSGDGPRDRRERPPSSRTYSAGARVSDTELMQ